MRPELERAYDLATKICREKFDNSAVGSADAHGMCVNPSEPTVVKVDVFGAVYIAVTEVFGAHVTGDFGIDSFNHNYNLIIDTVRSECNGRVYHWCSNKSADEVADMLMRAKARVW